MPHTARMCTWPRKVRCFPGSSTLPAEHALARASMGHDVLAHASIFLHAPACCRMPVRARARLRPWQTPSTPQCTKQCQNNLRKIRKNQKKCKGNRKIFCMLLYAQGQWLRRQGGGPSARPPASSGSGPGSPPAPPSALKKYQNNRLKDRKSAIKIRRKIRNCFTCCFMHRGVHCHP